MAEKPIGTFLAPNKGLSIAGDHAYAYSGLIQVSDSEVTHLEFTTGAEYLKGRFELQGATNIATIADGEVSGFVIYFNGEVIAQPKVGSAGEAMPTVEHYSVIIPPLTKVKVAVRTAATSAGWKTSVGFVGRVYA
jgi:hypothetical protein